MTRVNDELITRDAERGQVVVDPGSLRLHALNDSAGVILDALRAGEGEGGAAKRLTEAFDVELEAAAAAVKRFIGEARALGLVQ
jgi:hypothetical protein